MTTCFFVLFSVAWSSSVFGFWNIGVEMSWGICKIKSIVYRRLDMQAWDASTSILKQACTYIHR